MNIKFVNLLKTIFNNHRFVSVVRKGNDRGMVINLDQDAEVEIDLSFLVLAAGGGLAYPEVGGGVMVSVRVGDQRALELLHSSNKDEYNKTFGNEMPEVLQNLTIEEVHALKGVFFEIVAEIATEAALKQLL